MEAKARTIRAVVCLVAATWFFTMTPNARAEERGPVVVGEVGTRVARSDVDLPKALRRALERELAGLDVAKIGRAKRYVLSASVVKLEGRREGARGVACAISFVLREQKSGAIRAVLVGRAEADAEGNAAELDALDAAARGAVASVPEAMR